MTLFYVGVSVSFFILLIINLYWLGVNIYYWSIVGLQAILQGFEIGEGVYASIYLKWILLADAIWLAIILFWSIKRKHFLHEMEKVQDPNKVHNHKTIRRNVLHFHQLLDTGQIPRRNF